MIRSKYQAVIPDTSPEYYISRMAALNIPAPEDTLGDWHFAGIFGDPDVQIPLAGNGPESGINTNSFFGIDGVHECSRILREMGIKIPEETPVYSANHYRALLDLVLLFDKVPAPVPLYDFLADEREVKGLLQFIDRHRGAIPADQMKKIEDWIQYERSHSSAEDTY